MSNSDLDPNILDAHIPDYVLGRADTKIRQQIEKLMLSDKQFEKQVRVEQALLNCVESEKNTPDLGATKFDVLQERINADRNEHQYSLSTSKYFLPAIAAAFLLAIVALPLLVQTNEIANKEFEALSAPLSLPASEQKLLRVIFNEGVSERRRNEIASQYSLEVFEAAGALNSIIYSVPEQARTEQLIRALQQEQSVEFVALTGAIK